MSDKSKLAQKRAAYQAASKAAEAAYQQAEKIRPDFEKEIYKDVQGTLGPHATLCRVKDPSLFFGSCYTLNINPGGEGHGVVLNMEDIPSISTEGEDPTWEAKYEPLGHYVSAAGATPQEALRVLLAKAAHSAEQAEEAARKAVQVHEDLSFILLECGLTNQGEP